MKSTVDERYLLREGGGRPVEYVDSRTGRALEGYSRISRIGTDGKVKPPA